MKISIFSLALSLATFTSAAHAQEATLVYSHGGGASPEEYAAALAAVSTALRTSGHQVQAAESAESVCDPDPDIGCLGAVLRAHGCVNAAIVTYWSTSEIRSIPQIIITLADETGIIAVAEDLPQGSVLATTAAEMVGRAFYDWPRRAGVILHLDTIPSHQHIRLDNEVLESPITRRVMLGRHIVVVGTAGLIHRDFTVHGESEDEIHLLVRLDEENEGSEVGGVGGAGEVSELSGPSEGGETEVETPAPMGGEGSAWPSYVVGGGLVLAGAALWVSPVLTLASSGDLVEQRVENGRTVVMKVGMDGGQIALAVAGSVLITAGAVLMVGGWLRTSGTVTNEGAMLHLEGSF